MKAKIDLEPNTEFVEITGSAFNKTRISQSLRYLLRVIKSNPGGTNALTNDQSGRIVLSGGEKQNLCKTTISANSTDRIVILLLIYDRNNSLLGMERVIINGTEKEKAKANNVNDHVYTSIDAIEKDRGVALRGIVIQETKTKPGRDFYTFFYNDYVKKNVNGEKIVTIKESLALANNTKIEVWVERVKISEFILRPQNDYLVSIANESIFRVIQYFENLSEGKYIVKHY